MFSMSDNCAQEPKIAGYVFVERVESVLTSMETVGRYAKKTGLPLHQLLIVRPENVLADNPTMAIYKRIHESDLP